LIILQKDLGTASIVVLSIAIMLVIAGVKARYIVVPLAILAVLMVGIVLSGKRVERNDAWLNAEGNPNGAGFQTLHSLIAVGSGGVLGRGFCLSREKWSFLPAAQNDSILAIIAEELGFFLTIAMLFLPYMFLVFRGFSVAHRAPDEFGALVATGCTVMIGTQALMNMAVALNAIPTMGVNLPFISYGGSSLTASMMMAGLLLNVLSMRPIGHRTGEVAPAEQPVTAG
jgi:cell division protein FtsW